TWPPPTSTSGENSERSWTNGGSGEWTGTGSVAIPKATSAAWRPSSTSQLCRRSFFHRPADRLGGHALHHLQLDQLVGQHPQRPRLALVGRVRAGDGDQPGLGTPVQHSLPAPPGLHLSDEGPLPPPPGAPVPDPGDA